MCAISTLQPAIRTVALVGIVIATLATAARAQADNSVPIAEIHDAVDFVVPSATIRPGTIPIEVRLPDGATWVRMELSLSDPSAIPAGADVEIVGIEFLDARLFSKPAWTPRYIGSPIRLRVREGGASLEVKRVMVGITPVDILSTFGDRNLREIADEDSSWAGRVSAGVVLIETQRRNASGRMKLYPCTGFAISRHLVLTNWHCVRDEAQATTSEIYFDYTEKRKPRLGIRAEGLLEINKALDASVLIVNTMPAPDRALRISATDPSATDALRLVQQYRGRHQMVSWDDDCRMILIPIRGRVVDGDLDQTDHKAAFSHGCDTDHKSSGSPVLLASSGEVVGLHYWGFGSQSPEKVNKAARSLKLVCWLKALEAAHAQLFVGAQIATPQHCSP